MRSIPLASRPFCTYIPWVQKKLFTELGLSPELLKAIAKIGFEEASPIQSASIPPLLAGSDVVGQSQTGSGKTAAFAVPAIERVDPGIAATQVIILCPTRELAMQVAEEVAKLAFFKKGVRELPIYGGQSYQRQFRGLQQGAHIVIGTPGRVMDHLDRGTLKLDHVKMVILDEADRMLDMGFLDDIKKILSHAPPERQTVLFSATLPRPIQELIKTFTRDPVNVRIESQALTVPAIDQTYYEVDRRSKLEVLCRLIDLYDIKFGLIFCSTKMMVDELTEHLTARGYGADKLHGDMTQAMRERVMAKFRKHAIEFLVATDVAARGLDVDDIEVVFNYDLPHDGEDYVHRIGRTGRAGRAGRAMTFVAGREIYKLQNIIRFTKGRIRRERVPSEDEVEQKRASAFFDSLAETLRGGEYQRHDALIGQLLDEGHSATDIASALIHLLGDEKARPTEPAPPEPHERPSYDRHDREDRRPADSHRGDRSGPPPRKGRQPREATNGGGGREDRFGREVSAIADEPGMLRLALNVGREHRIGPADIVGVMVNLGKLPKEAVGAIHLFPRESFVDISDEHANRVMKKLTGIRFKGHQLSVGRAA
jgi:ATP-dependent RNA helicase DeaD